MPRRQEYAAKQAEYQGHAEKLREMAEQSSDTLERAALLQISEAWLQLASIMKDLSGGSG
jgi:hypothetical protein